MAKQDIVYILKNNVEPEELRYSLRSIEKNFPHGKVWFYGGCPQGIVPDEYVFLTQRGGCSWEKVRNTIEQVCLNDDITKDFWLFNDDFFVMKKVTKIEPMVQGTLAYRIQKIRNSHNGDSGYSRQLQKTLATLKADGLDRLDYALHVPMLINRKKALEVIRRYRDVPMFRSLYGNYYHIGGILMDDVKIQNIKEEPNKDAKFLSTNDGSFEVGLVGDYIRKQFKEPCRYEVTS